MPLNLPVLFLFAVNLLPAWGVVYLDWDAAAILLLYWAENLIIGAYNILKMLTLMPFAKYGIGSRLFYSVFFMIHYGGFTAVHGLFLLSFLDLSDGGDVMGSEQEPWPLFLVFVQLLLQVIYKMWAVMPDGMLLPLIALAISHGVSYVYHFLLGEESGRVRLKKLMAQPYGRIVVMHFALLLGGIFVARSGSPLGFLLLLIGVKIVMDLAFHVRQHRRLQQQQARTD